MPCFLKFTPNELRIDAARDTKVEEGSYGPLHLFRLYVRKLYARVYEKRYRSSAPHTGASELRCLILRVWSRFFPGGNRSLPSGKLFLPPGKYSLPSGKYFFPPGKYSLPPGNRHFPPGKLFLPPGECRFPVFYRIRPMRGNLRIFFRPAFGKPLSQVPFARFILVWRRFSFGRGRLLRAGCARGF
jgi:hypothetical protein